MPLKGKERKRGKEEKKKDEKYEGEQGKRRI